MKRRKFIELASTAPALGVIPIIGGEIIPKSDDGFDYYCEEIPYFEDVVMELAKINEDKDIVWRVHIVASKDGGYRSVRVWKGNPSKYPYYTSVIKREGRLISKEEFQYKLDQFNPLHPLHDEQ